jgi:hypothetical protein
MYVSEDEKKYAVYLQQELRMSGFVVDTEYTERSLKSQFKQAERLNSRYLVILNDEDLNNGLVQVKNVKTKEEEKIDLEYLIYYFDEKLADDDNLYDAVDHCNCGCGDECHCGDNCNCGDDCDCGDDCNCGDDCKCHHKEEK